MLGTCSTFASNVAGDSNWLINTSGATEINSPRYNTVTRNCGPPDLVRTWCSVKVPTSGSAVLVVCRLCTAILGAIPDFAGSHDRLDHPFQAPYTQGGCVHGDELATRRIEGACFNRRNTITKLILELYRGV